MYYVTCIILIDMINFYFDHFGNHVFRLPTRKEQFTEESKNLSKYRFENNFLEISTT